MSPGELTHIAEALGGTKAERATALAQLLKHPSSLVREGAVLGAQKLDDRLSPGLRAALEEMLPTEPSEGVRSAILDALDECE